MAKKLIPITLVTGYLGAGKTTLINYVLRNQQGYKVAVIVNDIGEVNIDETLIAKGGQIKKKDESIVPLSNGCICCTLKTDLVDQIESLVKTNKFDYILIEASGICEPIPIAQTLTLLDGSGFNQKMPTISRLDNVVSVVDAKRLLDEFGCGEELLKKDKGEDDVENLLVQQIEFCNTIVLNKTSELSLEQLKTAIKVIKTLQPNAKLIETNYGEVDLKDIFNTRLFSFEEAANSAGWIKAIDEPEEETETEEYGISTFVYRAKGPFLREKFEAFALEGLPKNVIRAKGICWFTSNDKYAYLFESAGRQKYLSQYGIWVAAAPKAEKKRMIDNDPTILDHWDKEIGDRNILLVFIGQKMDKDLLVDKLDECLLNK